MTHRLSVHGYQYINRHGYQYINRHGYKRFVARPYSRYNDFNTLDIRIGSLQDYPHIQIRAWSFEIP